MNATARLHKQAFNQLLELLVESGVDEIKFPNECCGYSSLNWNRFGHNLELDEHIMDEDYYFNRNVASEFEPIPTNVMFMIANHIRLWKKLNLL